MISGVLYKFFISFTSLPYYRAIAAAESALGVVVFVGVVGVVGVVACLYIEAYRNPLARVNLIFPPLTKGDMIVFLQPYNPYFVLRRSVFLPNTGERINKKMIFETT